MKADHERFLPSSLTVNDRLVNLEKFDVSDKYHQLACIAQDLDFNCFSNIDKNAEHLACSKDSGAGELVGIYQFFIQKTLKELVDEHYGSKAAAACCIDYEGDFYIDGVVVTDADHFFELMEIYELRQEAL